MSFCVSIKQFPVYILAKINRDHINVFQQANESYLLLDVYHSVVTVDIILMCTGCAALWVMIQSEQGPRLTIIQEVGSVLKHCDRREFLKSDSLKSTQGKKQICRHFIIFAVRHATALKVINESLSTKHHSVDVYL